MSKRPCQQFLPPEWAPQSGVMLTWPHAATDWAPILKEVEPVYLELARHITPREKLLVVCNDNTHKNNILALLKEGGIELSQVVLAIAPSNDSWARDHGPITVMCQEEPALLDFQFNGWGNKYAADLDNRINGQLMRAGIFNDVPLETESLVLEGGSIEVDGSGTLLSTEACLLAPTRNPQLDRDSLEQELKSLLGLNRVLWLKHGHLAGDDTDSHIDTLARFCSVDTIAYSSCDDTGDEHHEPLAKMAMELESMTSARGKPYELVPLPIPAAIHNDEGTRLPATYANFLIINSAVLVPVYNDPHDQLALARLQQAFPDREIIAVNCLPLIHQYGSLHCITMQLPHGVLPQ